MVYRFAKELVGMMSKNRLAPKRTIEQIKTLLTDFYQQSLIHDFVKNRSIDTEHACKTHEMSLVNCKSLMISCNARITISLTEVFSSVGNIQLSSKENIYLKNIKSLN